MTTWKAKTQDELDQVRAEGEQRRHVWYNWYILLSKEQREQHYKPAHYSSVDRISDYNGKLLDYFIAEGSYPTSPLQNKTVVPPNASEAVTARKPANSEKLK